jgi:hypothetical protein
LTNARSREAELINKPATTSAAAMSVTIVVDDEDDDVLVSSPRSFAQVRGANDMTPITNPSYGMHTCMAMMTATVLEVVS